MKVTVKVLRKQVEDETKSLKKECIIPAGIPPPGAQLRAREG